MPRSPAAHPPHPPGSTPAIISTLLILDGRSMRTISQAAGLSPDAVRNVLRGSVARPKTLAALARAFGVGVSVLVGDDPVPAALPRPSARIPQPPMDVAGGEDPRRRLRQAVRAAVEGAVAAGLQPRAALADAALSALLAAVSAGLDADEAAGIFGALGT